METPGMPAPFWFVQLFKVIGFVLHMVPMGLWFAGIPIAVLCAISNTSNSRRYAERMFGQFPIVMALGINFGIVPLLFLQTTYYKPFYTATILMAWHWLAIIPILIVGYYSLYLAAFSVNRDTTVSRVVRDSYNWRLIGFGVLASLCLTAIGVLITNGLTLMVRSDLWPGIMEKTNYFGATTGLGNNMRDPAVWMRFATMFSLGLMTTGVWAVFDSHFLMKNMADEPGPAVPVPGKVHVDRLTDYRRWTLSLAMVLSWIGLASVLALLFVDRTILKTAYPYFISVLLPLIGFTFCVLSSAWSGKKQTFYLVAAAALMQIATLATFGILRQIGQNAGVKPVVDVAQLPTAVQWSPLITFLLVFVLGLGVIGWMVRAIVMNQRLEQN